MNIFSSISWIDFLLSLCIILLIYNLIVAIFFLANKTTNDASILPENKYSEDKDKVDNNEEISFQNDFEEETMVINVDELSYNNIETVDDYQYTEADNPPLPITPEEQELIDQRFLDEETIDDDNSEEYSDEGVVTVGPFSYTDDELLKLNLAEEIRSGVKDDESKEYLYAQLRAVQD